MAETMKNRLDTWHNKLLRGPMHQENRKKAYEGSNWKWLQCGRKKLRDCDLLQRPGIRNR